MYVVPPVVGFGMLRSTQRKPKLRARIRHSAAESVFTPFREDMHASASSARLSILADLAMESLFILRMNRLMHAGGPASVASVGLCRAKIILTVRL